LLAKAILSSLASTSRRHLPPLFAIPPSTPFLAIAALENLDLCSVDISHAYLNGILEEEIYMQQPEGFEEGGPDHVCRLRKLLYGLKQAGRVWNKTLHAAPNSMGFSHVQSDHGHYTLFKGDAKVLMIVFVNDIMLAGSLTHLQTG
jgi:hypothetical protein